MIAAPYLGAAPCGRPHPCYEHHRPDPTPLPDFVEEFSGTPVVSDPTARQCRGDCAPPPQARPVRTSSWTRSIATILTNSRGRRTARARGRNPVGGVPAEALDASVRPSTARRTDGAAQRC